MSALARALVARIEAATRASDFGAVGQTLTRCATGVKEGEFEAGEAGLILRAAQEAKKAMRDAVRRMELIDKAAKVAETKRRADQARVTLALEQFKRLDDRNWTTQLLAAGNTQKGRTQKRR
jgi:hypothetical protein